jgi:hypothetical protein
VHVRLPESAGRSAGSILKPLGASVSLAAPWLAFCGFIGDLAGELHPQVTCRLNVGSALFGARASALTHVGLAAHYVLMAILSHVHCRSSWPGEWLNLIDPKSV